MLYQWELAPVNLALRHPTYIVHSSLELDHESRLGGDWHFLPKHQRCPLLIRIVCDSVGSKSGFRLGMLGLELGAVYLELERVEHDLFGAFLDVEIDCNSALIAPLPSKLEVVDGDGVVGRLDPVYIPR